MRVELQEPFARLLETNKLLLRKRIHQKAGQLVSAKWTSHGDLLP
jgi:hypothetical protein